MSNSQINDNKKHQYIAFSECWFTICEPLFFYLIMGTIGIVTGLVVFFTIGILNTHSLPQKNDLSFAVFLYALLFLSALH